MATQEVELARVGKRFAGEGRSRPPHAALSEVTLSIPRGELVVLVGPSGCGKSTTLRLVAGLDEPDEGTIAIAGRPMRGVAPQDRDVAMVFQGYALYPHMTARQIMEFPLKMRGMAPPDRAKAVSEAADMLGLGKLLDRRPDQLSGGERQRVAMGRAIVRKPRVFLFDEPLSNLDAALRGDIRLEIGSLVRRLGATALYVTHDHVEAMTLADRIVVMRAGRVEQIGTPRELYERPCSTFVATFLGSPKTNLLAARVDDGALVAGPFRLPLPAGDLPRELSIGVRPEDVRLDDEGPRGEVVAAEPLGAETHLVVSFKGVAFDGVTLRLRVPGFRALRGERVGVAIDPAKLHYFDPARDGARVL